MKPIYKLFLPILFVCCYCLCFTSCNDESDATPISVWFNSDVPDTIASGMRMNVKALLLTGNGERIKSYTAIFDDGRQEVELKSEELNGATRYNIDFNADVPFIQDDEALCKIKIKVIGVNGFTNTIDKKVLVYGALKDHSAGFKLYAANSTGNNGFYLSDLSTTLRKADTDSLDIYFYYDCSQEDWAPKCEGWKTDSKDINFVCADNYDYAKATAGTLQTTYESSVKVIAVNQIEAGNIIIVGYKGKAWGVFNCMAYDSDSRLYTFSYKLIGR